MTPVIHCPNADALNRLMLGLMQESEALAVEEHVADCPRCSEHISQHQYDDDLVRAVRSRSTLLESVSQSLELIDRLQQLWMDRPIGVGDTQTAEHSWTNVSDDSSTTATSPVCLDPPQAADELGRFGIYVVRKVLGRGGMGIVFLADDTRLSRQVALKVLLDAPYNDPVYLARFAREAESLARLQHPHIVRIYEVGEHRGRPYLALEYVKEGTLAERLAVGSYTVRESARLIESLALAVHYAHSMGVVHRDLKPSNILLAGEDHRPLISDFGLAKRLDSTELTLNGDLLGTPGYIAPEVIRGERSAGASVDIYSLGSILYELLAGRPPFCGDTVLKTLELAQSSDPVSLRQLRPSVPSDLETICLKCLQREPDRRYATAAALADDLASFSRGDPIRAKPVSRGERMLKWIRREPALAALIAVSAFFLVAVAAGSVAHTIQLRAMLKRVEKERQRADTGYLAARDTLDRMLARLETGPASNTTRPKELQRSLLEDALRFYTAALQQSSPDYSDVRFDTAVMCKKAATIEVILGQWDSANQHFRKAIENIDGLPIEQRGNTKVQMLLAGCHNNMGMMANNRHQWDVAEHHFRIALSINERLSQKEPFEPAHRNGIAQAVLNLATVFQLSGRSSEAEPLLLRAIDIRSALVREFPEESNYRTSLAYECVNLGHLLQQDPKRIDQAVKRHEQAESLLLPVVKTQPGGDEALTLAAVYINWGSCLMELGESEAALAKVTKAIEIAEAVLRQEPQHVTARSRTYNAFGTRAQMLDRLARYSEAASDWDRVVALDAQPDPWVRRLQLACSLARGGNATRAAAEAEQLATDPSISDEGLYNVACVYALTAQHCQQDSQLDANEQATLAGRCVEEAMTILRTLKNKGYFNEPSRAEALRTDDDLRSLRDRDDFQNFATEKS